MRLIATVSSALQLDLNPLTLNPDLLTLNPNLQAPDAFVTLPNKPTDFRIQQLQEHWQVG